MIRYRYRGIPNVGIKSRLIAKYKFKSKYITKCKYKSKSIASGISNGSIYNIVYLANGAQWRYQMRELKCILLIDISNVTHI